MDLITETVIALDLKNLTPEQKKYLHDLKNEAWKMSIKKELAVLKARA